MTTVPKGARPNNLAGLLVVVGLLLSSCSADPVPLSCLPGAQSACACPGGGSGVQVCGTDRVLGACQCGGSDGGMDAVAVDAGDAGSGTPDVGTVDLGALDVGNPPTDAAAVDVVPSEIGAIDTGSVDTGSVDTGSVDTGSVDTGSPALDAGTPGDAGDAGDAGTDVLPAGCVATTPGNCCGVACPAADHASPVCGGGVCTVACVPGYANCDGSLTNGCEVDLATNASHCGACGAACAGGQFCARRTCECPTGQALCGGRCVDFRSDAANCGACGAPCAAGRACIASACTLCASGRTVCPGACIDTQSSAANCGACGRACPSGQVCTAGACGLACTLGEGVPCSTTGTAPNCCAANRECVNLGPGTPLACRGAVGAACTLDAGCAGRSCQGGRCCKINGLECGSSSECCSGLRCSQTGGPSSRAICNFP